MFPILLNLTERLAVVIGGGKVGRRKAASLLEAGALVRLVCLEPRPDEETHSSLDWITATYCPSHLAGAVLVFAAGPPELNQCIVADARTRGLWVNSATDPSEGDFTLPATLRRGDFIVSVGTGGAAPALARRIRDMLELEYDETFGHWAGLLAELRPLVLASVLDEEQRRATFERWTHPKWLQRLRRDGVEAVRQAMLGELSEGSL